MAQSPKLEFRQSQSLVMTPQLQQAIKLLQMSNIQLGEFVDQEILNNPLLERDAPQDSGSDTDGDFGDAGLDLETSQESGQETDLDIGEAGAQEVGSGEAGEPAEPVEPGEEITASDATLTGDVGAPDTGDNPLDADFENVFDPEGPAVSPDAPEPPEGLNDWTSVSTGPGGAAPDGDGEFGEIADDITSLRDHLIEQVNLSIASGTARAIAMHLVDMVDEAGYLTEPTSAAAERLGCPVEKVEEVLTLMQGFDPCGVMARDLADCLAIQLRELDRLDPLMKRFLARLDLLAAHDLETLRAQCGVQQEDLTDMIAEIRELNPRPGLAFGGEVVQTVVPDVFVRRNPVGGWRIELNSGTLPKVLVNKRYMAEIQSRSLSKKDKGYVSECINNASWLVKSLDQRARTILKVSTEIVRQQEAFLEQGIEHLRPLNLRTVAEAVDMHESTVSRVTANKYMATPRGVFELKYFFTASISATGDGESHSAETVRHKIKVMVNDEDPRKILSDEKIVCLLRGSGIDIARRTVAKYRESLNIPSSVQRRRIKKNQAC